MSVHVSAIVDAHDFDGRLNISLHHLPRDTFDAITRAVQEHDNGSRSKYWSGTVRDTKSLIIYAFTDEAPIKQGSPS